MKTFTSSKGIVLNLKPVSQFKIDFLRAAKTEIPAPTYEVPIVGGGTQLIPMDAIAAKNKGRLPEWEAFVAARAKQEADYSKRFLELIVWDGVEVNVPDVDSDWQKSNDHFGIEVPDDPIGRKLFYVYNELLGTPEDIGNLIADVFEVSHIDEEAVKSIRDSFRIGIQKQSNKQPSKGKKSMEGKPDVQRLGSDSLLEKAPV